MTEPTPSPFYDAVEEVVTGFAELRRDLHRSGLDSDTLATIGALHTAELLLHTAVVRLSAYEDRSGTPHHAAIHAEIGITDRDAVLRALQELPKGTILIDDDGDVWVKRRQAPGYDRWDCSCRLTDPRSSDGLADSSFGPFRVVHIPVVDTSDGAVT